MFKPAEGRPIQLGLCCLNTQLREQGVFCSRKPIMATIKKLGDEKGIEYLKKLCLQNLQDMLKLLEWNAKRGIRVYRMSSEIFPHKSNYRMPGYTLDFAQDMLTRIGDYARQTGQRLTFHPGQYNVVGSPDTEPGSGVQLIDGKYMSPEGTPSSFQRTIDDLDWHAEVLDRIGCDANSVMVVHGGGIYGNKEKTVERWCRNYHLLPERVQRRLVLENCEKIFNIEDCLYISDKIGVPVVFDTHHYTCYNKMHPDERLRPAEDYMGRIINTWVRRGMKPKFHVSEQACCGPVGKHSDMIEEIPDYLMAVPEKHEVSIDIMIEAKFKELAIDKLHAKYPEINPVIKRKFPKRKAAPMEEPDAKIPKIEPIDRFLDEMETFVKDKMSSFSTAGLDPKERRAALAAMRRELWKWVIETYCKQMEKVVPKIEYDFLGGLTEETKQVFGEHRNAIITIYVSNNRRNI